MFEDLSQKLEQVFKKLRGQGKITEANVTESLREVRRVLLDADVNYKVAKQFIDDVQKRSLGQEVLQSITPGQQIVKIIFDELIKLMGGVKTDIALAPMPPTIIMVAGLQGSGKTTFCAKLARYLKGKGRYPCSSPRTSTGRPPSTSSSCSQESSRFRCSRTVRREPWR